MIKLKHIITEAKKNIFSDKVLQLAQKEADQGMVGMDGRVRRMGSLGYLDAGQILAHNEAGVKKHDYAYSHVYGVETRRGRGYNVETYYCRVCGKNKKEKRSR